MTGGSGWKFIGAMWQLSGGRLLPGAVLTVIAGLTEGLSLMLLIPLVALVAPGGRNLMADLPVVGGLLANLRIELWALLAIFVVLIALQAVLTRAKTVYTQRTLQMIAVELRQILFRAISLSRWEAIQRTRTSDINHLLTNDVDRIVGSLGSCLALFQAFFMLTIYAALAAAVSWRMAVFAVIVGSVLFLLLYPMRRRAARHGKDLVEMYQAQNATVLEFISGIRLAKLFVSEERQVAQYRSHLGAIRAAILDYAGFSTWGTVAFQVGTALIAAVFVWMSVSVYLLELPRLALLLLLFTRIAPRFSSIQENIQLFLSESPAFEHYNERVAFFRSARERSPKVDSEPLRLRDSMRLEGATVRFENAAQSSLDTVDIEIAAGKVTALIGASGSGKSTLADLVTGLTSPTSGTVSVDGTVVDEHNRRGWRASVASVPQDAYLMNDSIAANLRLGQPDATDAQVWHALERAQIAELVRNLPDQLETLAGERGARFSGGERQRFALARALLRDPELLVLDEATSALDWESQQLIAKAIADLKGQLTILTIAHRPSLIAFADEVIALVDGRVAETGRYADLKARGGSALARMLDAEAG